MYRLFNRAPLKEETFNPEALTDEQALNLIPKDPDIQWVYEEDRRRGSTVLQAMEFAVDVWRRSRSPKG
jgi:hypothetical protein